MKLSNAEHKQLLRSKYVYRRVKYIRNCSLLFREKHIPLFEFCASSLRTRSSCTANARELETKNERGGRYYCTVVRLYIGRQLYMNSQGIVVYDVV